MKTEVGNASGIWKLSRNFRFEAAHRLGKNYPGKCSNIHGHSWNGKISVACEKLNEFGFGVDFSEIGNFTKDIEKQLDHALLLGDTPDNSELIKLSNTNGYKLVLFPDNPSCEIIAKWIYQKAKKFLSENSLPATVISVEIRDGCITFP